MATKRIILIDVVSPTIPKPEAEEHLQEIVSLIKTYRDGTIIKVIQRREVPHPATYIGSGKAEEVAQYIKNDQIDIVIINGIVSEPQLYRLTKLWWPVNESIKVWDRVDLILNIFQKHAHTAEAKLQIAVAQMKHMGPRMYGLSEQLGRQGGGIGGRGIGETNVELMKRHWRLAIREQMEKIKKMEEMRLRQIRNRASAGCLTLSIVGYTNAGKTTLFNRLTSKHKLAKDVLFATLDTTTGKVFIPELKQTVLVSDTIGFIQDLPPELIEAFKSTLLASIHADVIVHVVDVSDPNIHEKIRVVDDILCELKITNRPTILIFNKTDRIDQETLNELMQNYQQRSPIPFSVQEAHLSRITLEIGRLLR